MEPNNIENQFRDKLNSREIAASENAWDRIDAMLTIAEKPKKNYRWLFFAASFLGFVLIATVFFNQTEDVVDSEHHKVVGLEKTSAADEIIFEQTAVQSDVIEPAKNVLVTQKVGKSQKNKDNLIVEYTSFTEEEVPSKIAGIPDQKASIKSIITREQSSNGRSNQKTEVNVDANSLLASVDNHQPLASLPKNTVTIAVNTSELLAQVDDELELSFREKVIQSVNKKYKEVKVAVAKRNLE